MTEESIDLSGQGCVGAAIVLVVARRVCLRHYQGHVGGFLFRRGCILNMLCGALEAAEAG